MQKQIMMGHILAVTLLVSCCPSKVSAQTIVTEYQFNPNGDWFADPPQAPNPGVGTVDLTQFTTNPGHSNAGTNNMYNYATTAPINDDLFGFFGPSGFSGPGLNLMIQNRNKPLNGTGTGAGTLALRGSAGRLSFRTDGSEGGGGSSFLGWSSAAPTSLGDLDFALSIGPASNPGEGNASWEEGMRLAIQHTSGDWYLSNWASNGKIPLGETDPPLTGTSSGIHLISLSDETWAPFTPATVASTGLVTFDAGSATFSAFAGQAQAFGFYLQDQVLEGFGATTAIRTRMNGFRVVSNPAVIPEPSSALALCVTGIFAAGLRRRRA